MDEGYYEAIGRILNDSFSQNKDPFEVIKKDSVDVENGQGSQFLQKENVKNICDAQKKRGTSGVDASSRSASKVEFQKMKIPKVAVPKYLVEDFLTLKLIPGASLEECKASWKNLLKRYHPDLQASENVQYAELIIRINNSFRRIERWFASCKG